MQQKSSSLLSDEVMSEKIQIYISARKLDDLEAFTTTNSFLVISLIEPGKKKQIVLKTKVYYNDLNPNYAQSLLLDFYFEIKQKLIFEIFHESKPPKLLGTLESSVGQIFGSTVNGFIKPLKNSHGKDAGKLIVRCEKIDKGKRRLFYGQICATNLPNFKWLWLFGGTNSFFRIFRKRKNDELLIYESEVVNNNTSPLWKPFRISETKLCKNNDMAEIQFRFYQFSQTGNHTLIGVSVTTVAQAGQKKEYRIQQKGQHKGILQFNEVKRTIRYEFGDYLENGLQLALVTCIDFTASNGHPDLAGSLHYSTMSQKSTYQQAISDVLDILMDYDYDKLVPCYGFGAQVHHPKLNTHGKVHHCFPLNFDKNNPNIYLKENIIKSYRTVFPYIKFSGPTKFSELLKQGMQECKNFQFNEVKSEYMVLFIITDGQIHDKTEVIDLIIQCNRLPVSIVIIGVGKGEFSIMHELDDDNCEMIDSNGNRTERDLVQFVQFANYKNNGVQLARQVLYELPRQVAQYFQLMGIQPTQIKRRPQDIEDQIQMAKQMDYPALQ